MPARERRHGTLAQKWPAIAVTGYVAATTVTFLARHHWLADLVTHLRPRLLVVAGLLAALLTAARRGRWIPPLAAARSTGSSCGRGSW